jgi:hypothetical protein
MNATTNRYDELSPREQLDIDELINTIAAHRGIDHPTMRRARTSVQRATREFQTACQRDAKGRMREGQTTD